jgi:glycine betaine/choline ABC-type transport system substrate-binding protein
VVVANAYAKKYGLKSIGDLKKAGAFKFGAFPECKTRSTCLVGYKKQYGLTKVSFVPLSGISVYAALDSGKIQAGDGFSTDPPLGKPSKYTVLTDPKHVTGFQNVAPIVKASVATAAGPKFASTVNAVSAKTAGGTYALAKKLEKGKGYTLLKPTPFYDTDVLAVTNGTAKKYGLKSIGDLKKVGAFKLGGFPECKTRNTCFVGYTKQYGISKAKFVPLAGISAYAALDAGKVLAADVFSTDPPLGKGSKYTVLADPKHVTGFQNVAPIVKASVATELGSKFTSTVNAVSAKLTIPAIVAMNKAVIVNKQSAAKVAAAFLKANGLS